MTPDSALGRDWRRQALCAGHPHREWWFNDLADDTLRAVAICEACPVRDTCLDVALATREQYGVWGGKGPSERRRIARAGRLGIALVHRSVG